MRKHLALPFWLAIFLFTFCRNAFPAEIRFFRSNDIGMKFEEIDERNISGFSYILEVEKSGETETRRLFSGEKEVKRWELAFYNNMNIREERTFIDNKTDTIKLFDRKGRPTEEQVFSDASMVQKTRYFYSEGQTMNRSETYDPEGGLLYHEEYEYSEKGKLRNVRRTRKDGNTDVSSYIYGEGRLVSEVFESGNEIKIVWFNSSGMINRSEVWRDDKLIRKKILTYSGTEGILTETQEEDLLEGLSYTIFFNKEGKMRKQVVKKKDKVVEELIYSYDNEGRQSKTERKSGNGLEEWIFSYNTKNELVREEYYRKGVIEKQTIYSDEVSYVEELFRKGELAIRIHYDDGEKVKEEFIDGGKVIRERTFIDDK
ncbi:MAG: hypothetical protein JW881_12270 [Spirochaetales bacterium]|nr:hypothetical protein [Spirochaetales bacterium]